LFYGISDRDFLIKNRKGQWLSHTSSGIKEYLANQYPDKGQLRQIVRAAQDDRAVNFIGPWCGKREGFYDDIGSGRSALVTEGVKLIEPAKGEWMTLKAVIDNALGSQLERYAEQQLAAFHGWITSAYTALYAAVWRAAQMLALAGKVNSCKSLIQWIITLILGGRAAKPAQYLQGVIFHAI
jgi:hypothetical protein